MGTKTRLSVKREIKISYNSIQLDKFTIYKTRKNFLKKKGSNRKIFLYI